jgi:superfamily II DNA or RNA helicase
LIQQLRVLSWRASTKDIAAVVGPPGCGKTTVGITLAVTMVAEGLANRVLLVAYTNAAAVPMSFAWSSDMLVLYFIILLFGNAIC